MTGPASPPDSRGLNYVGAPPDEDDDLANSATAKALLTSSITQNQLNGLIQAGFADYDTTSSMKASVAVLATRAVVDSGDAACVHVDQLGQKSVTGGMTGVAVLDSTGRVTLGALGANGNINQRFPQQFVSPSAYNSGAVSATSSTTVYQLVVPDPGYPYVLAVHGSMQCYGSGAPQVSVMASSPSGTMVASGVGMAGLPSQWGLDDFDRVSSLGLGPGYYSQQSWVQSGNTVTAGSAAGTLGIPSSGVAKWVLPAGNTNLEGWATAFRSMPSDATTLSDSQQIRVKISDIQAEVSSNDIVPRLYVFGRVDSLMQSMVAVELIPRSTTHAATVGGVYCTSGGFPQLIAAGSPLGTNAAMSDPMTSGDTYDVYFGYQGNPSSFAVAQNGTVIWTASDSVSLRGSSNRGWGFGAIATSHFLGGYSWLPPSLSSVRVIDPLVPYAANGYAVPQTVSIVAIPLGQQTILTGKQTLYIQLSSADGVTPVTASSELPALSVTALPATSGTTNNG